MTLSVEDGVVTSLEAVDTADSRTANSVALPGLVNAHSHAFHRLLRGRTHDEGGDFWVWRRDMYRAAEGLTPDSYEEIATAVYVEMAMAGITAVGEFHYLHHQADGLRYDDPNEMGHTLVRAARRAGIRICLLDVGYFTAGFDQWDLDPVQIRFRDPSPEQWLSRVDDLTATYADADDVVVGLAPHSVRAVPREVLGLVASAADGRPVHIHVSEQPAENEQCLQATGMTPTELLADVGLLGPMTTLVHATHLTENDIGLIGSSSTGVCYCTTTERDLADGLGPAAGLAKAGARLCVGTDSHALIDVFEETRGMEMHQRLASGRRGVLSPDRLMEAATTSGSESLGFSGGGLSEGAPADFTVLDTTSTRLSGIDPAGSVAGVVFAATAADVAGTWVGGRRVVGDGVHNLWEDVRNNLESFWSA